MPPPKAIIADDEKALRDYLKRQLAKIWPELDICAEAENGEQALDLITTKSPDIAFLDIRMPGLTGIDVASQSAGLCRIVFVTAYDQYAVDAFEKAAADYLLKPVTETRLRKTVDRLKKSLGDVPMLPRDLTGLLKTILQSTEQASNQEYLNWIRAKYRDGVRLIPTTEVCYFKAVDKYTIVRTRTREALIRTPIKTLVKTLDPKIFCRIHRSTIVNFTCIDKVSRGITGRLVLKLKDPPETLMVSRSYAQQFKQM